MEMKIITAVAYKEWAAIGQNYELVRFEVTPVAFAAGFDAGLNAGSAAGKELVSSVGWIGDNLAEKMRELCALREERDAALLELNALRAARPVALGPAIPEGAKAIPCMLDERGWLFIPHIDDKWVSFGKLDKFSGGIIEYWLRGQA